MLPSGLPHGTRRADRRRPRTRATSTSTSARRSPRRVNLATQNYSDTNKWQLVGRASGAQAFILDSSVTALGALTADATAHQTIDALVLAGAVALAAGGGAVGVAGAGASSVNEIAALVAAYIDGDGATGITAASVGLTAQDTSTIHALTGAASIAASIGGTASVSGAIGVALAWNTIANDVEAYIAHADSRVNTGSRRQARSRSPPPRARRSTRGRRRPRSRSRPAASPSPSAAPAPQATNVILTRANAHIDASTVTRGSAVTLHAADTATIEARVLAVAAAVGAGGAGVGVAIGASVARNFIGWDPTVGATGDYDSTATVSSVSTGKKVTSSAAR